jgi:predicted transposase/invertase (TIGR01784 family)
MTKKEIPSNNKTSHDEYFKKILTKETNAKSFIKNYLSEEIVSCLDLETLKIKPETFIDNKLKKHCTDVLYGIKTKTNKEIFIYTLIEHKSRYDKFTSLQLLRYMVEIYYKYKKINLPLVIPILIYNGKKEWKKVEDISSLLGDVDSNLKKFIPSFSIEFKDLAKEDKIKGEKELRLMIFIAKLIRNPELIKTSKFYTIFINTEKNIITSSVLYILEFIDEKYKPFLFEKLEKALKEVNLMSIAQSLRDEGKQLGLNEGKQLGLNEGKQLGLEEGIEKGKQETAKKLLHKGIDINIISDATGLSIEQIKSLK